jgi:integrase/recombinase XerD
MMHSLTALSPAAEIAAQATRDEGMIALWIGNYRSANTRGAYTTDVQAFAASIGHMAPATVSRRLSAAKSLIALEHRLGYLPFDVAAPVQLPAIEDGLARKILTEWQVQRMLEMERNRRNAALLRLTYSAGLRVSEVCGLRWNDLVERTEGGQISVFGKGGKTRVILLPAPIWTRVTSGSAGVPLATGRRAQPLAGASHRQGGGEALCPGVRTLAAACPNEPCVDRGAPIHVVQQTLGHASLSTTIRYSHARPGDSSARYLTA